MGAQDNSAAAVVALMGIFNSPMVRDPVFGAMLHTYRTRIDAVQPPESEGRQAAVIGWGNGPEPLLYH